MFLPTCIIVCTALRVVRSGRKVIPWFFFFFFISKTWIIVCTALRVVRKLLFLVFTFQKKKRKNVTLLELDQIIAVAPRKFSGRWNIPTFIIYCTVSFSMRLLLYFLSCSFPQFLSIFCSYISNLPPI